MNGKLPQQIVLSLDEAGEVLDALFMAADKTASVEAQFLIDGAIRVIEGKLAEGLPPYPGE